MSENGILSFYREYKRCSVDSHVRASNFLFLHGIQKCSFFLKNLCANMHYLDAHANIFPKFFILSICKQWDHMMISTLVLSWVSCTH
jgi:hypothetical protein